jgi:hypothetical protein
LKEDTCHSNAPNLNIIDIYKIFTNIEKQNLLTFLFDNNIKHSSNSKGYYINLHSLDEETLVKIYNYIQIIYKNKIEIEKTELLRNNTENRMKKLINELNENKQKKRIDEINNKFYLNPLEYEFKCIYKNKNKTESEWTNLMINIEKKLKKRILFAKNNVYYRINKIIKNKNKFTNFDNYENEPNLDNELLDHHNQNLENQDEIVNDDEIQFDNDENENDNDENENDNEEQEEEDLGEFEQDEQFTHEQELNNEQELNHEHENDQIDDTNREKDDDNNKIIILKKILQENGIPINFNREMILKLEDYI